MTSTTYLVVGYWYKHFDAFPFVLKTMSSNDFQNASIYKSGNSEVFSDVEKSRLRVLEAIIERGLKSFISVGLALAEIKSNKMYRQLGYETFDSYCQERWGLKRTHAFSQIKAAIVVKNLSDKTFANGEHSLSIPMPTNERQVRPLISIKKPELQRTIWTRAVEVANGVPTGKIVQEVATLVMQEIETENSSTDDIPADITFEVGDICIIQAGSETSLKRYQGFWCVIKQSCSNSYSIDVVDGTLDCVKPEYLNKLDCSPVVKDAASILMNRLQRINEISTVSRSINAILFEFGSRHDFILPELDEEILTFIENRLSIKNNE